MSQDIRRFSDRLHDTIRRKKSYVVVGLDPRVSHIPSQLLKEGAENYGGARGICHAMSEFNRRIIDAVCDYAIAVKPQLAYYEQYGSLGIGVYEATVRHARERGLLVIADAKRNDIGTTAEAYAAAYLGGESPLSADAVTVNPYFGSDGLRPFIDEAGRNGRGLFVLCRTSNPSAPEIQDVGDESTPLYCRIAGLCHELGRSRAGECGYSDVGLVVGATYPAEAARIRRIARGAWFLVPGYGAQGAGPQDVLNCFGEDGMGAIVNSSRSIIFAYEKAQDGEDGGERASIEFDKHAAIAARRMRDQINEAVDGRFGLPF